MASTSSKPSGQRAASRPTRHGRTHQGRRASDASVWLNELDAILNDDENTDTDALKARLREQLDTARNALNDAADTAADTARSYMRDAADCLDVYVETRPWHAIACAAGAAFVLGVIVGRK